MGEDKHYVHDKFDFCKVLEVKGGKPICIVSHYNGLRHTNHEVIFEEVSL